MIKMNNTLRSLLVLSLCLLFSAAAFAQSDSERERARTLYDEAAECYDLGRYDCALEKWQEVYDLTEVPSVLYNLGNTHERLGNLEEAVERLQQYRPHAREGQTQVLDSRIANLQERLELRRQAEAAQEAEREQIEEQIREREQEAERLAEEREELEQERARLIQELERAEEARRAPAGLRAARWTTLGIGVAGVATGVGFQIRRASLKSDLENACSSEGGTFCPDSVSDDVDSYDSAKIGVISGYAVGGAALTASLITFLVNPNRDATTDQSSADVSFAPTWYAGGGGGFQLSADF
jgi:tetratricopeptide (TPR) repeat protein